LFARHANSGTPRADVPLQIFNEACTRMMGFPVHGPAVIAGVVAALGTTPPSLTWTDSRRCTRHLVAGARMRVPSTPPIELRITTRSPDGRPVGEALLREQHFFTYARSGALIAFDIVCEPQSEVAPHPGRLSVHMAQPALVSREVIAAMLAARAQGGGAARPLALMSTTTTTRRQRGGPRRRQHHWLESDDSDASGELEDEVPAWVGQAWLPPPPRRSPAGGEAGVGSATGLTPALGTLAVAAEPLTRAAAAWLAGAAPSARLAARPARPA
jgi:hypothetical protein